MKKHKIFVGLVVVLAACWSWSQGYIQLTSTYIFKQAIQVNGSISTVANPSGTDPGNLTVAGSETVVGTATNVGNSVFLGPLTLSGTNGITYYTNNVGTSGRAGFAVLSSGAVLVLNTNIVWPGDVIQVSYVTAATSIGTLIANRETNGAAFVIFSATNSTSGVMVTNSADTNIVWWQAINFN